MGVIGNNAIGGSTPTYTNATTQRLIDAGAYDYVAPANEEVFRLWYYTGGLVGDGSGVEVGVYDITSGTNNASLVASGTITSLSANSWNSLDITGVALTEGNTYAVAFRIVSATDVSSRSTYVTGGASTSSLTGTSALAANWTDNGSSGEVASVYAETQVAASGLTLDSAPANVRNQTSASSQVSTPATAPTTLNSEVKWIDDTGPAADWDSITGTDPYTFNYTFNRLTPKLFDAVGYPLYHEVDAENVTSAGNIPYLPIVTQDFTVQSSPVEVDTVWENYAGTTPATGGQCVYDKNLTGDVTITMTVDAQGYIEISGTPSVESTADFYAIAAVGGGEVVDVEGTITVSLEAEPDAEGRIIRNVLKSPLSNILKSPIG